VISPIAASMPSSDSSPSSDSRPSSDSIAPVVTAISLPSVLWPPDHRMVSVNNTVIATDICDPTPSIILTAATSSDPDDAPGGADGYTINDIQGATVGTPDFQILLRAERNHDEGPGRTYTMTYRASDRSGNAASTFTIVTVPHDMEFNGPQGTYLDVDNGDVNNRHGTVVTWEAYPGAQYYNVIRGDLGNLRVAGSEVDLGQVVCIAHAITGTSTAGHEDNEVPQPGHVFFYAVSHFDGLAWSSYGSESAGRARVVKPSSGDCT